MGNENERKIFKYVKDQYKTELDYPFSLHFRTIRFCAMEITGKWFALIMKCPEGETRIKR